MLLLRKKLNEFSSFSDRCFKEIEKIVQIETLKEKDYFSRTGDFAKHLCLVQSGILRIFFLDENGQEWNKHFMQVGDFVAASVAPDKPAITNIQALSETYLIKLPLAELKLLAINYPTIEAFIQKLSFSYLSQKQDREISLLSNQAMQNYLDFQSKFPMLENKISHYHIASYLGITPIQLSRLRKKLQQ